MATRKTKRKVPAAKRVTREPAAQPEWTAGMAFEASEGMRMEDALRITNERLAVAASSADIGVWDFDLVHNRIAWDDRLYRLYGRSRDDPSFDPTRDWRGCIHRDDIERVEADLTHIVEARHTFHLEFRVCWQNGDVRDIRATGQVLRDRAGKPLRIIGANIDVTERNRYEDAIRQNERFMRILTDNLPEMIGYWTPELRCTFANAAYAQWFGRSREDVIGRCLPELLGEAIFSSVKQYVAAALRGEEQRFEQSRLCPDQRTRDFWIYYLPDRDGDKVKGVISVLIDVGELKRAQGRLQELNVALQQRTRQAEAASVAKTLFLANMSHEIRTPLSAVIGLTHLLEQTSLDVEQSVFVDKINIASRSLLGTINDVLDLSKIEAGEMHVEEAAFDLHRLIAELASIMTVQAQAKQIALDVRLADDMPVGMSGDATRINQILTNLLSNAIKFTDRGVVSLTVSVLERSATWVSLRFSVRDTGIGMAPEMTDRVFLPFTQADASTTRKFGGTGLGLSIVKRLCTLLNGEIYVTSTPGRGSEFTVTLPLRLKETVRSRDAERLAASGAGVSLTGVHVLVADDSELNLEIAQRMLLRAGATVTLAHNGAEAVELLSRPTTRCHAVLMDVHMPVLDGLGATRRIRSSPGLSTLPIIAITAGALLSERQRAMDAGMNDFITKPFDPHTMIAALRRQLPHAVRELPSAPPTAAGPVPDDWPVLEGMDATETFALLSGGRRLFARLLQHLCAQLEALEGAAADASTLTSHLHKLTGSAAMLGAKSLQQAAGEAERIAHIDPAEGLRATALTVIPQLRRLREAAAGLMTTQQRANRPSAAEPDRSRAQLDTLIDLLAHNRVDALEVFEAVTPFLQLQLGEETFVELDRVLNALQYNRALEILTPLTA
jgi:PAS domain S-box-containing protein